MISSSMAWHFPKRRFLARGKMPFGHFLTETSPVRFGRFWEGRRFCKVINGADFKGGTLYVLWSHGSVNVPANGHCSRESEMSHSFLKSQGHNFLPLTVTDESPLHPDTLAFRALLPLFWPKNVLLCNNQIYLARTAFVAV